MKTVNEKNTNALIKLLTETQIGLVTETTYDAKRYVRVRMNGLDPHNSFITTKDFRRNRTHNIDVYDKKIVFENNNSLSKTILFDTAVECKEFEKRFFGIYSQILFDVD
jgi:hypothetical protein